MSDASSREWYIATFCQPQGHDHPDEASLQECMMDTIATMRRLEAGRQPEAAGVEAEAA